MDFGCDLLCLVPVIRNEDWIAKGSCSLNPLNQVIVVANVVVVVDEAVVIAVVVVLIIIL